MKRCFLIGLVLIAIACEKVREYPDVHGTDDQTDNTSVFDTLTIRTFPDSMNGQIDTLVFNGENMVNFVWIAWDSTDLTLSVEMLHDFFSTIEPFATYKDLFNTFLVYHRVSAGFEYSPWIDENPTVALLKADTAAYFFLAASAVNLGMAVEEHQLVYFKRGNLKVMAHELGHLFGLGDEYIDDAAASLYGIEYFREMDYPNIDTLPDLSKVKWRHFIGLEGYESVGAYEGAFFHETGFYRPENNSIMNMENKRFNAPGREAIVKRIYEIVGLEYSFEEFLENDLKK